MPIREPRISLNNTSIEKNQRKIQFQRFSYKDHVTRRRYELTRLTKNKMKTEPSQSENGKIKNMRQFLQKLKMIGTIQNNRNEDLLQSTIKKRRIVTNQSQNKKINHNFKEIYQQLRNQTTKVNKILFGQYLKEERVYHPDYNKIFRMMAGNYAFANDPSKIKKIIKQGFYKPTYKNAKVPGSIKQAQKSKINEFYDRKFKQQWNILSSKIAFKIRSQAQYNWAGIT